MPRRKQPHEEWIIGKEAHEPQNLAQRLATGAPGITLEQAQGAVRIGRLRQQRPERRQQRRPQLPLEPGEIRFGLGGILEPDGGALRAY